MELLVFMLYKHRTSLYNYLVQGKKHQRRSNQMTNAYQDTNEYTGHLIICKCDLCNGACSETNPYCGDCFVCQEKEDDDYSWEVNRADFLQI